MGTPPLPCQELFPRPGGAQGPQTMCGPLQVCEESLGFGGALSGHSNVGSPPVSLCPRVQTASFPGRQWAATETPQPDPHEATALEPPPPQEAHVGGTEQQIRGETSSGRWAWGPARISFPDHSHTDRDVSCPQVVGVKRRAEQGWRRQGGSRGSAPGPPPCLPTMHSFREGAGPGSWWRV